ncbi:MAG: hypothetical protein ACYS5V_04380 [Planctomycetota bacterium]
MTKSSAEDCTTTPPTDRTGLRTAAVVALIVLALIAACSRIWNYDIFWHLAAGDWMLEHGRVLRHDPFGIGPAGEGPREWVDVHWGFQLVSAALHRAGGFAALTAMKMALLAATVGAMALWLRRRVGAGWLLLVGIWLLVGIEPRVRARPEVFTFAFLAATLLLVESVRQGASPRRLWWLAAINVLWVNMHGLFVVGLAAAWAAVAADGVRRALGLRASKLASRQALLAMGAATLACLVSPWPIRAALHPIVLWRRLAGHGQVYTRAVSELAPTWQVNPLESLPVLLAGLMVVAVAAAMVTRIVLQRRMVPLAHVFWLVMFATAGAMARRNTPLLILPLSLLLALHGGAVWGELARRGRIGRRAVLAGRAAAGVLLVAVAAGYATEAMYRWQRRTQSRFGFGLARQAQPIAPAKWVAESPAAGDVMPLEFGNGGMAAYYCRPRRVSMDGRLELRTLEELIDHERTRKRLRSVTRAGDPAKTPLPPSVRFLVVRPEDTRQIEAIAANPRRFRALHADPSGVVFERLALPGETVAFAAAPAAGVGDLDRLDRPLEPGSAALLDVPTRRRWYRQNVPALHWRMGAQLYSLGLYDLAARYLTVAWRAGLAERSEVGRILAQTHQQLSRRDRIRPDRTYPADIHLSRALAVYGRLDWKSMSGEDALAAGMGRVWALLADGQLDAAAGALETVQAAQPTTRREQREVAEMVELVRARCAAARAEAERVRIPGLRPSEQAQLLAGRNVGRIEEAIDLIRQEPSPTPASRVLLGDLCLRRGLVAEARRAYEGAADGGWRVRMRLGLCDWAEGNLVGAADRLGEAADDALSPAPPAVYLALLGEQTGHYRAVRSLLAEAPAGPGAEAVQTKRLLALLADRLALRAAAPEGR